MLQELKKILRDIKEKTGTEVSLEPLTGAYPFPIEFRGQTAEAYLAQKNAQEAQELVPLIQYLVAGFDGKEIFMEKREYLKRILLGEGGSWNAFRFMTRFRLQDRPCLALDIVPERRVDEALAHIERCVEGTADMAVKMDDRRIAVVCFTESSAEFAQFLSQSIYEELGVKAFVGVGCEMTSFSKIADSYTQAVTAVRMSELFRSKGEVHSYREYLLVRLLEEVPQNRLREYAEQFRIGSAGDIFQDEEIIRTAEAFLENSLNLSETSRSLFMHRNTLMYRLDKIERETGLDIRNFSDAVTFRVICILHKLLNL